MNLYYNLAMKVIIDTPELNRLYNEAGAMPDLDELIERELNRAVCSDECLLGLFESNNPMKEIENLDEKTRILLAAYINDVIIKYIKENVI